jgi:endonuclease YncB( thermonuclease family)
VRLALRNALAWAWIGVALCGWHASGLALAQPQPGLQTEPFEARVVAVVDGDTLRVRDSMGKMHRIRLGGIDAPERAQPYSRRSARQMQALVLRQNVRVEPRKTDRYGRTVAKVWRGELDVAMAQVEAGMAWHYKAYEAEQAPVDRLAYAQAEEGARSAKRGLWQDPQPVPPWEFRRQRRSASAR